MQSRLPLADTKMGDIQTFTTGTYDGENAKDEAGHCYTIIGSSIDTNMLSRGPDTVEGELKPY